MNHYAQTLLLAAHPETVFAALSTQKGIRGWWTEDCDVDDRAGGAIHLRFGRNRKDMLIEGLAFAREVRWLCTDAYIAREDFSRHDEWVGTTIIFRLSPHEGGRTRLEFEHVGLVAELECYELCSNGWNHFLASLRAYVESGRGTPHERPATAIAA